MAVENNGILLPRSIGSRNPGGLFSVCSSVYECDGDIVLNASEVSFIDPLGFAVLGALLRPRSGRVIQIHWLSPDIERYMHRMNFFEHCDFEGIESAAFNRNDKRESLVELTCISDSGEVDRASDRLATAITGHLTPADPDEPVDWETGQNKFTMFSRPIQYALSELLENALTHARRFGNWNASVWVAAQYYPSTGAVCIAVADNGCGILASLGGHEAVAEPTHEAAIVAALKPRVSCNRDGKLYNTHGNQGVGLTTLQDRRKRSGIPHRDER